MQQNALIGKYFIAFDNDKNMSWYGSVVARLDDLNYLVCIYSRANNSGEQYRIAYLPSMQPWWFYKSKEEWDRVLQERESIPIRRANV